MTLTTHHARSAGGKTAAARVTLAILVVAAASLSLVGGASPALAATPHVTHIVATAAATTVKVGASLVITGTVEPAVAGRKVSLQRLDGHHWRRVSHATETSAGTYTLTSNAPEKAATLLLRVVRAAARPDKAGASTTLSIQTVNTAYVVTSAAGASVACGTPITVTGTVTPVGAGPVELQQLVGSSWHTLALATVARSSTYRVSTTRSSGSYRLRVLEPQTAKVAAGASAQFIVVVAAPV